jgi:hypothetical protein
MSMAHSSHLAGIEFCDKPRARACPALVGLAVLSQPPSKPKIFEQETAC